LVKAAWASPLLGILVILSVLESNSGGSLDEIWRLFMSVGLGILVTLLGALYHNMDRRLTVIESKFIGREEYDRMCKDLVDHLSRIETHLEKTDDRVHIGRT
jgi:hypothetical protein